MLAVASGSFAADSAGELHVLGHDGNSLSMYRAQVGVLEKTHHIGLGGLLESEDGRTLKAKVVLEGGCDVAD